MKIPVQEVAYFYNSLKDFGKFIEFSERLWVEELEKYKVSINDDNETNGSRFNYHRDLSNNLSIDYPQLQRKSNLVMLIALFEDFLNQVCCSVQVHEKIGESFNGAEGKGIERAKKYLTTYSKISFPSNEREWQHIKDAQSVRNIIVHSAGHIDSENNKKQLNIVTTNTKLGKSDYARTHLVIEYDYLFNLIDYIEDFCKKLMVEFQ